jgi:hypothetical protein
VDVVGKAFCVFNSVNSDIILPMARFVKGVVRASVMAFRRARARMYVCTYVRAYMHT